MRILVCGGRNYVNKDRMFKVLDTLVGSDMRSEAVLIHGDARGADRLSGEWAKMRGVHVLAFSAQWQTYKNAAGPIRNRQMLVKGKPDIVVVFPGGSGTHDMLNQARLILNIDVLVLEIED